MVMKKHHVMQHAKFETDILNIVTLFEISTGASVLGRPFHTLSDIA